MKRGAKVVVAGAGVLGTSTALALATAGHTVRVCDPAGAGRASSVAAGMLAPVFEAALDPLSANDLDLLLAARDLWPEFAARSGVTLDRSGAAAVGSEAWLAQVQARLAALGQAGSMLPRDWLDDLAPGLAPGLTGLLSAEDWRLSPAPALTALRRAAEAAGAVFADQGIHERGEADWLVVATGAHRGLGDLVPELARLTPIKGQILRYAAGAPPRLSLRGEGCYIVPDAVGGLAVGATMEVGRDDIAPDPAAFEALRMAAARLFPRLSEAAYSVSAGVRAGTVDGLPMVGASATPGVILTVGARRNGWLLAPMVSAMVSHLVGGVGPGPYARRLDPARLAADRA